MDENPFSCQTKKTVTMKDYIKEYDIHLAHITFPIYKQVLDELGIELDDFYKDADWYNEKERDTILHGLLDDALFWLKIELWNKYYDSSHTSKNDPVTSSQLGFEVNES